jgi:CrcB protein
VTSRHPLHATVLLAVAVGAAGGASLRHALSALDDGAGFPWTTFAINVSGSFLLALLPAAPAVRRRPLLPPLLGTGMLGGFTTLSTYAEETRRLLADGAVVLGASYLVGTLAACLAAVAVADRFSTRSARSEFDDEEGDL